MRVLQISNFYPPFMGGIQTVTRELVEGLNRIGVHTDVLCANSGAQTVHECSPAGYRITRASNWGLVLSAAIAPSMLRFARQWRGDYDVVHVHMPNPIAALAVWSGRPKARVVVHWHSDVVRQRRALRLYEPLQTWLLDRADAIVATSPTYLEASEPLQRWRAKTCVIPIGISPLPRTREGLVPEEIRRRYGASRIVFALGRLIPYKGFDVLIEAATGLPEDCVVLLGGDGPLRNPYQQRIRAAGLESRVHLLGHIPEEHLRSYYEACDVFCLPSLARSEAFGVCMLDAMASGKPVVASAIEGSGVPWVNVHDVTGLNARVGDAAALCEALRTLLSDDVLRTRMGRAARKRYSTLFRPEAMIDLTLGVYEFKKSLERD